MFTGIIESLGKVESISNSGTNRTFTIHSDISAELHVDQSICHDGVCLTVEAVRGNSHQVTAVHETLLRSNLADWAPGNVINLERCLRVESRLDGHFVQGHVDDVGTCLDIQEVGGSWFYEFTFDPNHAKLLVTKGSVAVNGVSLTVIEPTTDRFKIAIIPYTYEHTNFHQLKIGDKVNLEFDIIGKYILRSAYIDQLIK